MDMVIDLFKILYNISVFFRAILSKILLWINKMLSVLTFWATQ